MENAIAECTDVIHTSNHQICDELEEINDFFTDTPAAAAENVDLDLTEHSTKPQLEDSEHLKMKEDLENATIKIKNQDEEIIQLQNQLMELNGKVKCLESDLQLEKSEHEKTKEALRNVKKQSKKIKSEFQNATIAFKKKERNLKSELNSEQSAHQKTKGELETAKSEVRIMTEKLDSYHSQKEDEKGYPTRCPFSDLPDFSKQPETPSEELQLQLQQTNAVENCFQDGYEVEPAPYQSTNEELEQANSQLKEMTEKCEGIRQQLQNNENSIKEDLLACTSVLSEPRRLRQAVIALKKKYIDNDEQLGIGEENYSVDMMELRTKLDNCTTLLEASLQTKEQLEEELYSIDNVQAMREQKYVKLINQYIMEAHHSKTQLANHILKCKKPVQEKAISWFKKKILRNPANMHKKNEEPPNLYPVDWRLPFNL